MMKVRSYNLSTFIEGKDFSHYGKLFSIVDLWFLNKKTKCIFFIINFKKDKERETQTGEEENELFITAIV